MLLTIQTHLIYSTPQPCDLLLQIEAAQDGAQNVHNTEFNIRQDVETRLVGGEEHIGSRRWISVKDEFDCTYQTQVAVHRKAIALEELKATGLPRIPCEATKFLMPSRYCHPEDFFKAVPELFGSYSGGALIAAMAKWIRDNFRYDNAISHSKTTATHSFTARAGVCRDYAHVLIAMSRAVGIPARFVSAYAPNVVPQDFHAVVEVYLENAWHLVDPTGMATAPDIVRIGVGRDAADVAFMTSYGDVKLIKQTVNVSRVT